MTEQIPLCVENTESSCTDVLPKILDILSSIRTSIIKDEYTLQDEIALLLRSNGIAFQKEYKLAPRNRIDFLIESGIGVEVKKGKPNRYQVIEQLYRYASFKDINAIILVIERNLDLPSEMNGKKCISFGLNRLWGVALK